MRKLSQREADATETLQCLTRDVAALRRRTHATMAQQFSQLRDQVSGLVQTTPMSQQDQIELGIEVIVNHEKVRDRLYM